LERAYDFGAVEARWRDAWERAQVYRAPERPGRRKFFNYDSGPFPTGPLHLGHVRTYTLGDVTARYQRLRGRAVLHGTEWDAFGLPNELAAEAAGGSAHAHTEIWIARMETQLRTLGIGYDWSRVHATCDPAYYRWTQRLFLDLLERGLVERSDAETGWCPSCRTALARMQVQARRCWRCGSEVERQRRPQWFVRVDAPSLEGLTEWNDRIKKVLRAFTLLDDRSGRTGRWLVSRQRTWGTPIPVVHCGACGPVPVGRHRLPVLLPEHGADEATPRCPRCAGAAVADPDRLDCFFDDLWCFLGCAAGIEESPFRPRAGAEWMPVDHFHSGFDTFAYLPLHRWLGKVLHDAGRVESEPIVRHVGHDLVLAGGRKMSKHLGNAVSPDEILRASGADALRVAVLWAAGPQRPLEWQPSLVPRAEAFLDTVHRLYARVLERGLGRTGPPGSSPTSSATALRAAMQASVARVGRLIDAYRPNAALQELSLQLPRLADFFRRLESDRLQARDAVLVREVLGEYAQALAPFAPYLAEELWHGLGEPPFVFQRPLRVWA
jgi:leucyl-tRNA synthetase